MMEKGMTTKIEVAKIGDKKWRAITTCKEIPAMNEVGVFPTFEIATELLRKPMQTIENILLLII